MKPVKKDKVTGDEESTDGYDIEIHVRLSGKRRRAVNFVLIGATCIAVAEIVRRVLAAMVG